MLTEEELGILAALQLTWEDDQDEGARPPDRRSPQTEKRYRYVAELIMRRAGTREIPGTITDAIELVVGISPTLRHATVRQYRAALLQKLRDVYQVGRLDLMQAGRHLRRLGLLDATQLPHGDQNILPKRCGAGRRRGLLASAQRNTVYRLRSLKTATALTLADLLEVGDRLGLRPWEWPNAVVQGPTLFIRSAKMSEWMGRGLVEIRRLDLRPLGNETIKKIAAICASLQADLVRLGTPERVMNRYARLLRKYRTDNTMVLRSARHQFRKNAQSMNWSSAAIAVAMNHAAAGSQHAYGRAAKGRQGLKLPSVDASLLRYVQPSRPHAEVRRALKATEFLAGLMTEIAEEEVAVYAPTPSYG